MGRAEDLFKRLEADGEAAIDQLIADRQSEELFLDFKRSGDSGGGSRLHQDDRKNLAKAVSGFGNSEGGVILWGVDCRDGAEGDVARAKVVLENPKRFKSWLEGAVSGCTVPPHPRVRHVAIESAADGNRGFVATLVPKSLLAPHQSVAPVQYYIRAGSDFVPTPHGVLAQLFGRRPRAFVFAWWGVEKPEVCKEGDRATVSFAVHFNLTSRGPGLARGLYFTLNAIPPKGGSSMSFVSDTTDWVAHQRYGVRLGLVSKEAFRLAPEGITTPVVLKVQLAPPFRQPLHWACWYGHEESPVGSIKREVSPKLIRALFEELTEEGDGADEFVQRVMDIPKPNGLATEGYEEE